jgi:CheY-like chemotaxis protein
MRILVVEDHLESREAFVAALQVFNATVASARDGRQGLQICQRFSPDVVLCDLQMPEMDGFQLLRALRAHPNCAAIPVVAISALDSDEVRQRVRGRDSPGTS